MRIQKALFGVLIVVCFITLSGPKSQAQSGWLTGCIWAIDYPPGDVCDPEYCQPTPGPIPLCVDTGSKNCYRQGYSSCCGNEYAVWSTSDWAPGEGDRCRPGQGTKNVKPPVLNRQMEVELVDYFPPNSCGIGNHRIAAATNLRRKDRLYMFADVRPLALDQPTKRQQISRSRLTSGR